LAAVALLPGRRYRAWGFAEGEDELTVKHGLMIRKVTIVPFGRVQHIDVAQGPIQRMLGLATLVLNTAGTAARRCGCPACSIRRPRRCATISGPRSGRT
jgi:membrane protein YdbS with pleckstrin-like domain